MKYLTLVLALTLILTFTLVVIKALATPKYLIIASEYYQVQS